MKISPCNVLLTSSFPWKDQKIALSLVSIYWKCKGFSRADAGFWTMCIFFFLNDCYSISKWRMALDLLSYPVKKQSANHVAAIIPPHPCCRPIPQRSHFWILFITWMILQCWRNCFVNACKLPCYQLRFQQKRDWLYVLLCAKAAGTHRMKLHWLEIIIILWLSGATHVPIACIRRAN